MLKRLELEWSSQLSVYAYGMYLRRPLGPEIKVKSYYSSYHNLTSVT